MLTSPIAPVRLAALLLVPLAGAACQRDTSRETPVTTTTPAGQSTAPPAAAVEERDNALVRVVNAMPATPAVDVFADDRQMFDDVTYKAVTPYHEVDGQRYRLDVRAANGTGTEPLASNSEGLDDGDHYTVFALPDDDGKATLRVVKDDHSTPADGKARLRVVNGSPNGAEIALFVAGRKDAIADGVNAAGVTDYDELDPVTGTIELREEGQSRAVQTLRDVRMQAGRSYTVVVAGRSGGRPGLDAFVIEDDTAAAPQRSAR